MLRRFEEQDFNNLFKVQNRYANLRSAFHHLLFLTLILGPFFAAFFGS